MGSHDRYEQYTSEQCARLAGPPAHAGFYKAITAEAAKVGWPEGYHGDIYLHDRRYDGAPCIWILRHYGTNIVPVEFDCAAHVRSWMGPDSFAWIETFIDRDPKHYHWDSVALLPITGKQAVELMRDGAERLRLQRRAA